MTSASILLVDDEEKFVQSNAKLLENRGYRVRTAHNGETALHMLAEDEADVVILDIRMPVMDGIAVLTQIKARFPLVEVILLSGQTTFETAVQGLKIGAGDYLMKPCRLDDLTQKIEEALEKHRINEEKQRYQDAKDKKGE